jgi:ABC-type polysaccharide/polyol phosphate export permease
MSDFDSQRDRGLQDLVDGLRRPDIWMQLALHETKQRYRRSMLGPMWSTVVLGAQVAGIGIVYGGLLRQDFSTYLPYLAASLTIWTLISGMLVEGTSAFIESTRDIKSAVQPISIHVFRLMARHLIILGHNIALVVMVYLLFLYNPGVSIFLAIPGLVLCLANLGWIILLLSTLAARYRDIPMMVASLSMLLLVMTPVFWRKEMLGETSFIVAANPFFHLLEVVRGPLFGEPVSWITWVATSLAAVFGWSLAAVFFDRVHHRIAYWV